MSARDDLIAGLAEHSCCFSEEEAARIVDAYAHELAEQVRSEFINDGPGGEQWRTPLDAANLIDPQKGKP